MAAGSPTRRRRASAPWRMLSGAPLRSAWLRRQPLAARKAEKERLAEEAAIEAARKAEEDRLDDTQSLEAFVQRFQQRMAALRARP